VRINNLHLTSLPSGQVAETPKADFARREAPEPAASESGFHTPSAELTRWVGLAGQEPEIRPQEVDRASILLASGHYLTPESAFQTAAAILRAGD
jgi:hypothetical protein